MFNRRPREFYIRIPGREFFEYAVAGSVSERSAQDKAESVHPRDLPDVVDPIGVPLALFIRLLVAVGTNLARLLRRMNS